MPGRLKAPGSLQQTVDSKVPVADRLHLEMVQAGFPQLPANFAFRIGGTEGIEEVALQDRWCAWRVLPHQCPCLCF